jgi:hypothetical protein
MARKGSNSNFDILDNILNGSTNGRSETVWIQDPRHRDGGYYVQTSDRQTLAETFKTVDDIEKYLRS